MTKPAKPSIEDYVFPADALIGEGAFGWVWLGFYKGDQPRAVKVFKPRAIREALWRSEYEKMRALDEPPGIVTLYDSGFTRSGDPFVAMRLMADRDEAGAPVGRTVGRALKEQRLSERDRWRIVVEVAETLAFMHRKDVLHCDIKPGNVLLTSGDEPRPVVCDFGQSRSEGFDGGAAFGTALYASPEQLRDPGSPDKTWDVYSFGVTAYQILTGELPRLAALAEEMKAPPGLEVEGASRDLTLVTQQTYRTSRVAADANRYPEPGEIAERIESEEEVAMPFGLHGERRDLMRIVLRCLRLGGAARGRFRDMEAVIDAIAEAARKRASAGERRKKLVFAVLTVFGLTAAGIAGWQKSMAEKALRAESISRERAEASDLESRRQRDAAEREKKRAQESELMELQARQTAEHLVNRMLYDLRDGLEPLGRLDLLDGVSRDAEAYFANLPESRRDAASERERSTMLNNRGDVLLGQGMLDEALAAYKESLELRRALMGENGGSAAQRRDFGVGLERVGDALAARGDLAKAADHYRESLALRRALRERAPDDLICRYDLSVSISKLGDVALMQGEAEEAARRFAAAAALLEELAALDAEWKRDHVAARIRLGDAERAQGDRAGARGEYEWVLAALASLREGDPGNASLKRDQAAVLSRLGDVLMLEGQALEASERYGAAVMMLEELTKRDPAHVGWRRSHAIGLASLGEAFREAADPATASGVLVKAVVSLERLVDRDESDGELRTFLGRAHDQLGDIAADNEQWAAAGRHYEASLAIADWYQREERGGQAGTIGRVVALYKLGTLARQQDKRARAKDFYGDALSALEEIREKGTLTEEQVQWMRVLAREIATVP